MPRAPSDAEPKSPDNELTIDDLAAETRVPSRTIRFYQSKGLLPRPQVKGRVAYYGPAHVERLKLVQELQDRGLQIKAIGDVVAQLEKGELALDRWLGLAEQLEQPWAKDKPRLVDGDELLALAGDARPGRVAELVRAGLVERKGDAYLVSSPALLQIATKLEATGVPLSLTNDAGAILRRHLARAAHDLVELFFKNGDFAGDDPGEVVRSLRPAALEAVRVLFAREVEREIRKNVESGRTTKLTRKRR